MKYLFAILFLVMILPGCSQPDKPELSEEEKLAALKSENDSLMIVFDSLMQVKVEVPPLIDTLMISSKCLEQFNQLARETNGDLKVVANSKFIAKTVADIIRNNSIDNADIMIVMDKTGSMWDDLENIKKGLKQILSSLKEFRNIRLAVSTYGDKNVDGALWYDFRNFETDFEHTTRFIEGIQVTGGGDEPESVYDGIYKSFQEGFWNSESKRIVILLGDAPSLDSTRSSHSVEEIIRLAKADRVNMNFYPVVISPYNEGVFLTKKMQNLTFIESVYPNPTRGPISIRLNQLGTFNLEIFSQSGEMIRSEKISSDIYKTDLYEYPDGLYIIRISDEDKNFDTRKIILNK